MDRRIRQLQQWSNYRGGTKQIKGTNEISETVIKISDHLQNAATYASPSTPWTICRAPPKLRRLHEHGFHPTLVAIGPFHWHKPHLNPMEAHKSRFLVRLLEKMDLSHPEVQNQFSKLGKAVVEETVSQQQLSGPNGASTSSSTNRNDTKIEYLVLAMKELEADTRACYSETFKESSSEFVMMMIMDSCFIVELLRLYAKGGTHENEQDPIFSTRWMVQSLKHDLIMLENQLPLPVLEKLFQITSFDYDGFSLTDLTLKFFDSLLPRVETFSLGMCKVDAKPNHLLGLFLSSFQVQKPLSFQGLKPSKDGSASSTGNGRLSYLKSRLNSFRSWVRIPLIDPIIQSIKRYLRIRQTDHPSTQLPTPPWVHERKLLIHCVTELKEAGISFKKRENCELLDIEFKNGKLYIPPLLIDDYTGLLFLNFVAYEQCNPWIEPYFTTYLLFLDSLLNSSKDVEHLHLKGIIDHVLGSDEDVAQLFNILCREVVHDLSDCYISKVLKDVNRYFHVRRHRWRAKWTHDYFSSPWAFISLIAAGFLLILTSIQTFFSVFSYIIPPS